MMDGVLAALHEGKRVMPRIEMEEVRSEWMRIIIRQPETEPVAIERHHPVDGFGRVDIENDVAEPQWPGAEAGDRAAGLEWFGGGLGAVEQLEPVADRIIEHNQIFDVALVGECTRGARDFNLCG